MRRLLANLVHGVVPRVMVNQVWNLASDVKEFPARFRPGARPMPFRLFHNVGGGDFHELGRRYFGFFKEATGLVPSDHVLDIGCGAGRLAFALSEYLDDGGRYTGFDVSRRALGWARRHVAGKAPFDFIHAPVASREYTSRGEAAARYRFPVSDASVDHALAISLFSHLLAGDAAHYLREAGRVLRPGGRLFMTGFIVDAAARERLDRGEASLTLVQYDDTSWVADRKAPERAIGYDAAAFSGWAAKAGLRLAEPIQPGHWSRAAPHGEYQDRLVLERAG